MAVFKIGDVVQLKSGGPTMTIVEIMDIDGETNYGCQWFVGDEINNGVFSKDVLMAGQTGSLSPGKVIPRRR